MTRAKFLAFLFTLPWATVLAEDLRPLKKFYITGLFHTKSANDCTIAPIEIYGHDREDALVRWANSTGCTVWTEEEFADMKKDIWPSLVENCKRNYGKDSAL